MQFPQTKWFVSLSKNVYSHEVKNGTICPCPVLICKDFMQQRGSLKFASGNEAEKACTKLAQMRTILHTHIMKATVRVVFSEATDFKEFDAAFKGDVQSATNTGRSNSTPPQEDLSVPTDKRVQYGITQNDGSLLPAKDMEKICAMLDLDIISSKNAAFFVVASKILSTKLLNFLGDSPAGRMGPYALFRLSARG